MQTLLLLIVIGLLSGRETGLPLPALPLDTPTLLLVIVVASAAVQLAVYSWRRYRV